MNEWARSGSGLRSERVAPSSCQHEGTFQATHLAYRLQGKTRARAHHFEPAPEPAVDPRLAHLSPEVRRALFRAAEEIGEAETCRALLALTRLPCFLDKAERIQRSILALLRKAGGSVGRDLIKDLQFLLARPLFPQLGPEVRDRMLGVLERCVDHAGVRGLLLALASLPGFAALDALSQAELLDWVGGPVLAADTPDFRQSFVAAMWDRRREELARLLTAESFLAAPAEAQAEQLLDFQNALKVRLGILDAQSGDHRLAIFSADDPRAAISFGEWPIRRASDRRVVGARLESPDRFLWAGWPKQGHYAELVYDQRMFVISRFEELELIQWLEKSLAIDVPGHARSLTLGSASVETRLLELLAGLRGRAPKASEAGLVRGGKRWTPPPPSADDLFADAELLRFLSS